jgi:hypothetical protein
MAAEQQQTILTKWGRLTSQEWLWRRYQEEAGRWWTPEAERYVLDHWPTPEQIEDNRRAWAQQQRAQRNRTATARAIADVARADRARPRSGSQLRTAPSQLSIL